MKRQLLSVVLLIVLALLTPGASRGREWLSTLQPVSPFGDAPEPTVDPACAKNGKNCGLFEDLPGHTVDCGTCTGFDTCGGGGPPNICGCTFKDCTGVECGEIDRGCMGGKLQCGDCTSPKTCGGGGQPNICGCTPKTCGAQNCGSIDPGCGQPRLSCGECKGFETCGGGGISGVCGCTPRVCGAQNCGSIDPGCGLPPRSCGQCTNPAFCFENFRCCTPQACNGRCGNPDDGCGRKLNCGGCGWKTFCDDDNRCHPIGGDFKTKPPRKDPDFCAAKGKNCGLIDDGHGEQVDCGTCKSQETCGGGGVPNVCGLPPKK